MIENGTVFIREWNEIRKILVNSRISKIDRIGLRVSIKYCLVRLPAAGGREASR